MARGSSGSSSRHCASSAPPARSRRPASPRASAGADLGRDLRLPQEVGVLGDQGPGDDLGGRHALLLGHRGAPSSLRLVLRRRVWGPRLGVTPLLARRPRRRTGAPGSRRDARAPPPRGEGHPHPIAGQAARTALTQGDAAELGAATLTRVHLSDTSRSTGAIETGRSSRCARALADEFPAPSIPCRPKGTGARDTDRPPPPIHLPRSAPAPVRPTEQPAVRRESAG